MTSLPLASQIVLYILMAFIGLFALLVAGWQVKVLQGAPMQNPDGSTDSWRQQKTHYGIAVADLLLACPVSILGIILVFVSPRWGYYLLALASFWFVWANIMTTATSLRFEKPRLTLNWFVTFPLGALIGLAYILWTLIHFNLIF